MGKTPGKRHDAQVRPQATSAPVQVHAASWIRNMLVGSALQFLTAPLIGIFAGFLLLFGGIFLAVAWNSGPQPLLDSMHYASFTGKVDGRIVESWAALEFDPADLPRDKLYWQPYAKIATCAVVDFAGDWGEQQRAFCGNRFQFRDDFHLDDWNTLAPGVPFAFTRDASGFAVEEIRLGRTALDWLSSHPPHSTFMLSKPPPTTALGALREALDLPLEVAVASWATPIPAFPLAFDPQHPGDAMPAKYVADKQQGFWLGGLVFTLILAIPGLLVWRLGFGIFLFGQPNAVQWLATIALLAALPWWGDALPKFLRHVNRDWASVASDMLDDISRVTRLNANARGDATLADGERLTWHVDKGAYADTFGRIHFVLPDPAPKAPDAARSALIAQVNAQVSKFDPGEQAALFVRLRQQNDAGLSRVQSLFFSAAEATLRDGNSSVAAHRAAREFLIYASGGHYYEDQLDAMEKLPGAD